jgi:hypothetical protein
MKPALITDPAVRVSANGRYFVDSAGRPLFWLGDTQWNLFRCHTLAEARLILSRRRAQGFNFIQVMLLGWWIDISASPVNGEAFPTTDPTAPNAAYFAHVDAIVRLAEELGLVLVIGLDHPRVNLATLQTARAYGRWIGSRYREAPNIIWVAAYTIPDEEHLPVQRELATGLREGDGGTHLITCHPDPAVPVVSSSLAHTESWLDFNSIQTFAAIDLIYSTVYADFQGSPVKPVVMAEGAYESGPEYGFPVTPRLVRKQAYLSYLAGGHHSYGHNENWRVTTAWERMLDAPGADQLGVLRKVFESLTWWELKPDLSQVSGMEYSSDPAKVVQTGVPDADGRPRPAAARAQNGEWALVYLTSPAAIMVRLEALGKGERLTAEWIDPRNGHSLPAGIWPALGAQTFTAPPAWEDGLLVLRRQK